MHMPPQAAGISDQERQGRALCRGARRRRRRQQRLVDTRALAEWWVPALQPGEGGDLMVLHAQCCMRMQRARVKPHACALLAGGY